MSSISFDVLANKFEILPEQAKKEVMDFIDRLSQKTVSKEKKIDRKKVLLDISCWNDDDIKLFDDVRQDINKWQPKAF